MGEEVAWLSVEALLRAYRRKELSPVEVVEAHLRRLDDLEHALNAFMVVDGEGARADAAAASTRWAQGEPAGPLDGVPITVKDIVPTKGWVTRYGSATTDPDLVGDEDAPSLARLREAGAVVVGKTTTPEFGWKGMTDGPLFGVTRNPWSTDRTPGGSSGGAGASLAAGIGAIAYGNDGGGSIRIPASYCGLYGLKPTFGRVPHAPQEGAWVTLVSQGPLARCVADAARYLNVVSQPDARDWYALPYDGRDWRVGLERGVRGLRVGYTDTLGGAHTVPEVAEVVRAAVERLEELGAHVEPVGTVFDALRPTFEGYWKAQFAARLRTVPPDRHDLLDPGFRAVATEGMELGVEVVNQAATARARLGGTMNHFHERYDLLVTPTMPTLPPTTDTVYHSPGFDRWDQAVPFTVPFNLTGQPAASLPVGLANGLPVGLQVVAAHYREGLVLQASAALESVIAFPHPHPTLLDQLATIGA